MNTRIVFMGSPDFALQTLSALAARYQVVGVVTQPDRPVGRGRTKMKSPPVKELADKLELPVIQPNRLSEPEAMEQLHAWQPDLIVVAAFGQLLRPEVLDLPQHGCINVHASLLPRWRGAAPINAAIREGDTETGITIMKMDPGLDTGPILSQRSIPIGPDETAGSLFSRLAQLGADLLLETLPAYLKGEITPQTQDETLATHASTLERTDGQLDFNKSAETLARLVRAYDPWPGTYLPWKDTRLKVLKAEASNVTSPGIGVFMIHNDLPSVGTSGGILILTEVQPAGKRPMSGETFLRGARDWATR